MGDTARNANSEHDLVRKIESREGYGYKTKTRNIAQGIQQPEQSERMESLHEDEEE